MGFKSDFTPSRPPFLSSSLFLPINLIEGHSGNDKDREKVDALKEELEQYIRHVSEIVMSDRGEMRSEDKAKLQRVFEDALTWLERNPVICNVGRIQQKLAEITKIVSFSP